MSDYIWGLLTLPGVIVAGLALWWALCRVAAGIIWAVTRGSVIKRFSGTERQRTHLGALAYSAGRAVGFVPGGKAGLILLWDIDRERNQWAKGQLVFVKRFEADQ